MKVTVEESTKPIPLIVRSCDVAPAVAVLGNKEVIVGGGFPEEPVTMNNSELVVDPLLVVTLTGPDEAPAGTLVWMDAVVELST